MKSLTCSYTMMGCCNDTSIMMQCLDRISYMEWVDFNIFQVGLFCIQVEALRRRMEITVRVAWDQIRNSHPHRVHVMFVVAVTGHQPGFMTGFHVHNLELLVDSQFGFRIWQLDFISFNSLKRYKQNGKQTHPRKDILSPVDERSRQLTSNSSLMGLESQCTNASKSTWHLFSPISLAFLQTCQVSNV